MSEDRQTGNRQSTDNIIQQAKDYAFNLLSYRDRSRAELRKRLNKKGYNEDIIESVLSRLEELNYINDPGFARKWVRDRIKHKPRGRFLIKAELKAKGISKSIINQVLSELLDRELELELGIKQAEKWLRHKESDEENKLKLMRYLKNKGFSYSLIKEIIDSLPD